MRLHEDEAKLLEDRITLLNHIINNKLTEDELIKLCIKYMDMLKSNPYARARFYSKRFNVF